MGALLDQIRERKANTSLLGQMRRNKAEEEEGRGVLEQQLQQNLEGPAASPEQDVAIEQEVASDIGGAQEDLGIDKTLTQEALDVLPPDARSTLASTGAEISGISSRFKRLFGNEEEEVAATEELQEIERTQENLGVGSPASAFGPGLIQAPAATAGLALGGIPGLFTRGISGMGLGAAEATAFAPSESDPETQATLGAGLGIAGEVATPIARGVGSFFKKPKFEEFAEAGIEPQFRDRPRIAAGIGSPPGRPQELLTSTEDLRSGFGVGEASEEVVQAGLGKTFKKIEARKTRLFDQAADKLSTSGAPPLEKFDQSIDDMIAKETAKGTIADKELIKTLNQVKKAPRGTFDQAIDMQRFLDDEIDAFFTGNALVGKKGSEVLTSLRKTLNTEITDFAKEVNPEGAAALNKANKFFQDQVLPFREVSGLKNAIQNNEPEAIISFLRGGAGRGARKSRGELIFNRLAKPEKAQLKSILVDEAIEKAMKTGEFNPKAMATEIQSLRNVIPTGFTKPEQNRLEGIKKVALAFQKEGALERLPVLNLFLARGNISGAQAFGITASAGALARSVTSTKSSGMSKFLGKVGRGVVESDNAIIKGLMGELTAANFDQIVRSMAQLEAQD